eukprot:TRINITY_DN8633_c0_g2_i2.p1 TRINITY_DN8633_c0_g2~~TRINITY_DN8633_c0_g2_i2.p1  ORF type:complete len:220 (-),score=76.76 TRINITY_DN8633_c0_g2_i2:558-1217(-)
MCIRDRYQRRVHGDYKEYQKTKSDSASLPSFKHINEETMVKLVKIETDTPITKKKYIKLSAAEREKLLDRVFFQQVRIKEVAKELKIHYSTAKKIVEKHKHKKSREGFLEKEDKSKICRFSVLSAPRLKYIEIIPSIGGHSGDKVVGKLQDATVVLNQDQLKRCTFTEISSGSSATSSPSTVSNIETPLNNWQICFTIAAHVKNQTHTHPHLTSIFHKA